MKPVSDKIFRMYRQRTFRRSCVGGTGMRIVAKDWDTALSPAEAFQAASGQAAW